VIFPPLQGEGRRKAAGWGRAGEPMSEMLRRVQMLVMTGDYLVSDHGFEELEEDVIVARDVIAGIADAIALEDYPDRFRGPSVLALHYDPEGRAIHVVWAIPAGERRPAVLVTAYRPDPKLWDSEFRKRI
jgi:hypothetical protein